jgi:hypothetical protein
MDELPSGGRDSLLGLEQRRAEQARPILASRPAGLREANRRLEEEHRVEAQANADCEAYGARGGTRTCSFRSAASPAVKRLRRTAELLG